MRLQKFMAEAGVASRRQCEEYIRQGRVLVNGEVALIGSSVEEGRDEVAFDGAKLSRERRRLVLLFYKPRGVVSTSSDPEGRKTVQTYFADFPQRLYNVGRLDLNSEGLIIMTNDGVLAQTMTHPKYKIEKTYYAVCDGTLTPEEAAALANGVALSDGRTLPARIEHVRPTRTGGTSFLITIREGRNRQVRRMLEAVGHQTLMLKRERVGALTLGELAPGEWRYANAAEMEWLDGLLQNNKNAL